jgi:hypothetical protein
MESTATTCKFPPFRLNGGWFTGEPFRKDAGWAAVPVLPDAGYMISTNLKSADPPPGATSQHVGVPRPGNNCASVPNVSILQSPFEAIACTVAKEVADQKTPRFGKYAYWTNT